MFPSPRTAALLVTCLAIQAFAARPYRGGAVAAAHPLATQAGVSMLDQGGNASDAAVAAAFVMAVVGPYHSGLGGGGFALVHPSGTDKARVLDFREVAPKAARRDMFVRDGKVVPGLSTDGGLSVAVPGAVKGYLELHERYGKLPRKAVLAPAIRAAKEGFWVGPKYRSMAEGRLECLKKDPEASRLFLRTSAGVLRAPEIGAILTQPELAKTLQAISRSGAKAFYEGKTAGAIESTVLAAGGVLTKEDLLAYRTTWREPLEGSYRGHRLATMPPPSAGGLAILQVLGVLEHLDSPGPSSREPDALHRYIEAVRRAYVDRARYLGDPAFVDVPTARLLSKEHLAEVAASIDPAKATPSSTLSPVPSSDFKKNTTHISVIDRSGNAVSLTTTVNYSFGSCLVAKGTGVLLNDEMDDFAAQPLVPNAYGLVTGEANAIAPGKIPLSSMSPTFVYAKDDPKKVMLAVGSPGGSTIPTTVLQVISNVVDAKMDVVRAVSFGRLHHQYQPDVVLVDRYGLEPATARALEAKGHKLQRMEAWGDAEAVLIDAATGLATAASDPRNEGFALGQD